MKQHQLRALVAVAESGSVRAGARLMSLSQTALTKAIQDLEADLQVTLLHRGAQGAKLTSIGLDLVERAKSIIAEIESAREHVARSRGAEVAHVFAASGPAIMMRHLPQFYSRFRSRFPQAQLKLQDVYLSQIFPKLRDGSLDVALTTILPECVANDLQFEHLAELEIGIMGSPNKFKEKRIELSDLKDECWVLDPTRFGVSEIIRQTFLASVGSPPRFVVECSSTVATLGLVEECDCVAPSPRLIFDSKSLSKGISEIQLQKPLARIPVGLLRRKDAKPSPAVEWMCECFRSVINAHH